MKVILVAPRGFCAGVDRAVKIVEDCLELFGAPVYVKHAIVHNRRVVRDLEEKGAVTVESVEDIPEGAVAVFSAHGSPPSDFQKAKERGLRLIDGTCPLVTKVHLEAIRYIREGYTVVYIGHHGHVEGIGVRGEAGEGVIPLVETVDDVASLDIGNPEKIIYLTQTTLSVDETKDIIAALKHKYPQLKNPPAEDICYATTNRQNAVKELAKYTKNIVIVGSVTSSNSKRLVETAKSAGAQAYLIDHPELIRDEWFTGAGAIGVSAGASAPEVLIEEIMNYFTSRGAVREHLDIAKEDIRFYEPRELEVLKKEKAATQ